MIAPLADIDLKLLRVFHTIVVAGGITPAQPQLNASQSTISTQLSQLETRLGFRLCRRGRSGFGLTERGQVVFDEARILFASIDDFRGRVTESSETIEGTVRIGLIDNIISHEGFQFANTIKRFKNQSPKSMIDIHIGTVVTLEQMVLDRSLDLAISFCHHRLSTLQYIECQEENHFLYCRSDHSLCNIAEEAALLLAIQKANYVHRSYLEGGLPPLDITLNVAAHADNIEALAILILSGEYIAFLPEHYARRWVAEGTIRPLLPHRISQTGAFHLILPKARRLPKIAEAFVANFRELHQITGAARRIDK